MMKGCETIKCVYVRIKKKKEDKKKMPFIERSLENDEREGEKKIG
jgi:hypothetical protein